MGILIFVAIALFLAGPILAIMALVAVRRMEGDSLHLQVPQLTSRIYTLEKRIMELEQAMRKGIAAENRPGIELARATPPGGLADKVRVTEPPSTPEGAAPSAAPPPAPIPVASGAVPRH